MARVVQRQVHGEVVVKKYNGRGNTRIQGRLVLVQYHEFGGLSPKWSSVPFFACFQGVSQIGRCCSALPTQDDYLSRRAHTVSDSAIDLPTTTIQELEKIEVERRERALLQDEEQDGRMELEMEQAENFRAIPRWEATARSKLLVWNRFEKIEGDARDVIVSEEGEV